ncbi:unnamed protein product [Spirodela intermedia]|uniref:Uncharacterized protein n=1 Tax=Spirodela intermedia TaxID=51605 RepID=A0A7I8IX03_SPIIN|nr:unnamed protein product [Spirodela intermedia]CAA6662524.1 unnamed protein product [Spirodela intermedia]
MKEKKDEREKWEEMRETVCKERGDNEREGEGS